MMAVAAWAWLAPADIYASAPRHSLEAVRLVAWVTAAAAAAAILTRRDGGRGLLRIWIVLGWIQGGFVLLQAAGWDPFYLWTGSHGTWRVYGTMGNPNIVAALLVPLALLSLSPTLLPHQRLRVASLVWIVAAVVATGSRAGVALLALGIVVCPYLTSTKTTKRQDLFLRVGAALIMMATVALVAGLMGKGITSASGRWVFWRAGLGLIAERPWFGHGLGIFEARYVEGAAALHLAAGAPVALPVHAHNDWIEFGVELGAVAAAILIVATGWAIWHGITSTSELTRTTAVALAVLAMLAVWDSPLHEPATALLFWMLIGILAAQPRMDTGGNRFLQRLPTLPRSHHLRSGRVMAAAMTVGAVVAGLGLKPVAQRFEAHLLAGEAAELATTGNIWRSTILYASAWERAPSEGEFAYGLAHGLALTGNNRAALAAAQEAVRTHSDFDLYSMLIQLEFHLAQEDEALRRLHLLESAFPQSTRVKALRASLGIADETAALR
jgi:O-antigen ligase